ncbi:hypothetical protein H0H87_011860 [Tephrocybe sp. NHM501043]|nr:hypothetical protein H0H87_011860 [Tephrocybe sp. NHM501043]
MVVDSYEERRHVWAYNKKNRERQDSDDPALYGPANAAQVKVAEFLMDWRFLSRQPPEELQFPEKQASAQGAAVTPQVTFKTLSEHPREKETARRGLLPKMFSVFQKILGTQQNPEGLSDPEDRGPPHAFHEEHAPVVLGFDVSQLREKILRRMTQVNSIELRKISIRKRKFTPAPKYEPTAEFLAELRPLRPPQYLPTMEARMRHESEEYRSLSWLKATPPKPEAGNADLESELSLIMPDATSTADISTGIRGRGRGRGNRGGLGKYLRARGRGRGRGRPAEFGNRLVLEAEQEEELNEEEAAERAAKYSRRQLGTNADRYVEPEPELGSDGEPEVEPEVDLSTFLEKQRITDTSPSIVSVETNEDDDVDVSLVHIGSGSRLASPTRKGKVESIAWEEGLDEMSREKASAEAAWDLKALF